MKDSICKNMNTLFLGKHKNKNGYKKMDFHYNKLIMENKYVSNLRLIQRVATHSLTVLKKSDIL